MAAPPLSVPACRAVPNNHICVITVHGGKAEINEAFQDGMVYFVPHMSAASILQDDLDDQPQCWLRIVGYIDDH